MSEFDKFKKKLLKKGYKIIRTYKKDFGQRIIGECKGGWFSSGKRTLIHHFVKSPTIKDFGRFVNDFEKFVNQFGDDYEIENGYFVLHGSYDKEGFNLILSRLKDNIRNAIEIVTLKEEKARKIKERRRPPVKKKVKAAPELKQVLRRIRRFKPYKMPKKERELEAMLVTHLKAFYPDIRTQLTYERARIDAQIGRIGIEIKYQPSTFDRLYGQIDKYLRHLDYVIAVIGYPKSMEAIRFFKKRLKERGWLNSKVFVISI